MHLFAVIAMHRFKPRLWLLAFATLASVAAEPTHTLAQAQTECESKRRSCIAECRAQYFSIDPKRDACIAACVAEANKCVRKEAAQQGKSRFCVAPRCFSEAS